MSLFESSSSDSGAGEEGKYDFPIVKKDPSKPPLRDLPLSQLNLASLRNDTIFNDQGTARWLSQRTLWRQKTAGTGGSSASMPAGERTPLSQVIACFEDYLSSDDEARNAIAEWTVTTDEEDYIAANIKAHGAAGRKKLSADRWLQPAGTEKKASPLLYHSILAYSAGRYVGGESLLALRATCKGAAKAVSSVNVQSLQRSIVSNSEGSSCGGTVLPLPTALLFCPGIRISLFNGMRGEPRPSGRKWQEERLVLRLSPPRYAYPFSVLSVSALLRRRLMIASGLPILCDPRQMEAHSSRRHYRPWEELDDCVLTSLRATAATKVVDSGWRYHWTMDKGPCFVRRLPVSEGGRQTYGVLSLGYEPGKLVATSDTVDAATPDQKLDDEEDEGIAAHASLQTHLEGAERKRIVALAKAPDGSYCALACEASQPSGAKAARSFYSITRVLGPLASRERLEPHWLPVSTSEPPASSTDRAALLRCDGGIIVLALPGSGQLDILNADILRAKKAHSEPIAAKPAKQDNEGGDLLIKSLPPPADGAVVTALELGPSLIVAGYSSGQLLMICRRSLALLHVIDSSTSAILSSASVRLLGHNYEARRHLNELRLKKLEGDLAVATCGRTERLSSEAKSGHDGAIAQLSSSQQWLYVKRRAFEAREGLGYAASRIVALAVHEDVPSASALPNEATSIVAWLKTDGTGHSLHLTVRHDTTTGRYLACMPGDHGSLTSLLLNP
jgi:hypothetical protein